MRGPPRDVGGKGSLSTISGSIEVWPSNTSSTVLVQYRTGHAPSILHELLLQVEWRRPFPALCPRDVEEPLLPALQRALLSSTTAANPRLRSPWPAVQKRQEGG